MSPHQQQQQQQQPQDGTTQASDSKKHRSSRRRNYRRSRGILSAIVSGEPPPDDEDSSPVSDDEDSSPVSDDSSSDELTAPSSRRRLGRGYHCRPKTERLTASTPRGQFISQRARTAAFQAKKCSSLVARDYHAVDAAVADIADRKRILCADTHGTHPAGAVTVAGTSDKVVDGRGSNTQLTEAAAVDESDCSPFREIAYRRRYYTWPLDTRSTTDPAAVDDDTDAKSHVSPLFNVGPLQRQNAGDLRPLSTMEIDQTSRPSVASASRSAGNVSIDKPEVVAKTCVDRQTGSGSKDLCRSTNRKW